MQNRKKLSARVLSLVLALAMVGTMLPATVFAAEVAAPADGVTLPTSPVMADKQAMTVMPRVPEEVVVEVGDEWGIRTAIESARGTTGDTTIKLTQNIDFNGDLPIYDDNKHNFTLDLNGYNLSAPYGGTIQLNSPTTLTITDSSGTAGTLSVKLNYTAIWNADENGTLNIYDVTIQGSSDADYASVINNDGTLNIYSGTIKETGSGKAIENGYTGTANIMGGTVQGTGASKAIENGCIVNISGGTVQAENNAALSNMWGAGKYIISGADTVITSATTGDNGTILFSNELDPSYPKDLLAINGGTISNTSPEGYSVYFAADTGVTGDNLATYYTKAEGSTVGKVFPALTAPKVSFDARNGGAAIPSAEISEGGTITMPSDPTWGDYTFAGWYTDKDGKGTEFANSGLTDSITVYAKWTKNGKAVRTEPLDLTGGTDLSGDSYVWNHTAKTLTLSGMTLNSAKLDHNSDAVGIKFPTGPCTIILVDGTENTANVSAAKGSINNSQAIFSENKLTIKTSGKGTPGKLNAIAGKATEPSFGIYSGGGIVIESGNITATAGDSTSDNSIGISTNASDIHIKGGTVNATAGKSMADSDSGAGSIGMFGMNIQIDGGTVTAIGGEATLSAGIVGAAKVKLNGGSIHATGKVAAVAALATDGVVIDDIANVKVNDKQAKVGTKNIGMNISTLLGDGDAIVADAKIKFKPSYTGTNPLAPDAFKATKTSDSITLPTQTITGETVEYGKSTTATGEITWQDNNPVFTGLTAGTDYYFYARVKETDGHKAGPTSAGVMIKTAASMSDISGTVTDKSDAVVEGATVKIMNGQTVIATSKTGANGKYTFADIAFGTYSLVVEKDSIKITKTIAIATGSVTVDVKLPAGSNTVVETKPETPPTAAEGLNGLFEPTKVNGNTDDTKGITTSDLNTITGGGSVTVILTAESKQVGEVQGDVEKIEVVASGQTLTLLDLQVNKVVTPNGGTAGNPVTMTELPTVIEIVVEIPENMRTAADISVYRVHGAEAAAKLPYGEANKNGDGEYAVRNGNYVHIFTRKFSTYALGYTASRVSITSEGANGVSGAGSYAIGAQVTINAGTKSGYSFSGWTVTAGTVVLANPSSASTTFIMPAENVTVTANWTATGGGSTTTTYRNTVNQPENGTVTVTPVSPSKGQTVTITTKPDAGYVVDTIIVKDANGKTIAVTEKSENSYTFVQPSSKASVEVTYQKAGTKTFTDVTANDWFYDAVMAATANGWFGGTSDTTFSPLAPTSRGMIATILHRMEGTPKATAASFDDVAADAYYANGIAWAAANIIVKGYGNGNYGPNDNITREQLAAILYRYAGYKGYDVSKTAALDSFADGKSVSGYAKDAMSWAVGSGLISGRGNSTLAPTATAARAEVATILVRFGALFTK